MYVMVCTRLNIDHALGTVSCFLSNPSKEHWKAIKWISSTTNLSLMFTGEKPALVSFTDTDMVEDVDS